MSRSRLISQLAMLGAATAAGYVASKLRSSHDVRQAVMMTEVASSDWLWTRAAVRNGRIFVCFPRWFADEYVPVSLGEVVSPGRVDPYPDEERNSWKNNPESPEDNKFICVQSVYFDDEGKLWVLDSANPINLDSPEHGYVRGKGPRLYEFDVDKNGEPPRIHWFAEHSYRPSSYFNDVRIYRDIEKERNVAFITDSGAGALIVLDLEIGDSWRLLDSDEKNATVKAHHSVKAEDTVLMIEGRRWLQNGKPPKINSDGIALSPDRKYLYYQALTGRTLYRIPTESLIEYRNDPEKLAPEVQKVGQTGAADGIQFGADGRLYFTAIEKNAITRLVHPYDRDAVPNAKVETVICGDEYQWPDSITRAADGSLYVTTSRIHLQGDPKDPPRGPFKLFRLQVGKLGFF